MSKNVVTYYMDDHLENNVLNQTMIPIPNMYCVGQTLI